MRVLSVRFEDDGTIIVDWVMEAEQTKYGGVAHSTWVSLDGQEKFDQVSYYVDEIRSDIEQLLLAWQTKDHDSI